jgi:hypothetical protein
MPGNFQNKKEDLKRKAELFGASLKEEYSESFKGFSPISKITIIGGGALLAFFLAYNFVNSENGALHSSEQNKMTENEKKLHEIDESDLRSEFKEKIIIVVLEILRQIIQNIISKLKPKDGKADL